MIRAAKRTARTLIHLEQDDIRRKHVVRMIAIAAATAVFFGLSRYLLHLALQPPQILLFVALLWILASVFEHSPAEKNEAQEFLINSEKLQLQKMEAIGRLAGGVAHDFNNLLAVITGYTDLLLETVDSSDGNRPKLEQIKQAANSAASLTRQLLMFGRQEMVQPVILDVNQVVSSTEKMLRRLIKENIEFEVVLQPNPDWVKADQGQIEQIILNLVVNARDAMPNGGKLCIETKNVTLDKQFSHSGPDVLPGRFVLVEVSDNGIGMDQETQAHIFEPFFSTKPAGRGTGLGLATVYGIVKQSNGHIEVQSTLGQGSGFKIYFPSVKQVDTNHESDTDTSQPVFSGETVLVVEDASSLRDLICGALSKFGCSVLSACDAQDALQLIREQKTPIDLLLTDVIMPGMNGAALAKEVRSLWPETKILYMTGHSGEFVRADMLSPGVSLVRKPFTPADLGRKIRKMLADKSGGNLRDNTVSNGITPSQKAVAARASR